MAPLLAAEEGYLPIGNEGQRAGWRKWAWTGSCLVLCAGGFFWGGRLSHRPDALPMVTETLLPQAPTMNNLWKPTILPVYRSEPMAKDIIRRFDLYLMDHATFDTGEERLRNVGRWLAEDFVYDTVGFPSSTSLRMWCLGGEESHYRAAFPTSVSSQMLFFGDETHATTTSYINAHWVQDLNGVPAPMDWVYLRVTDFYLIRKTGDGEGRVSYNLMMTDFADLFRQVGRPVLPKAALPEGLVMTARANDGVPAPLSVLMKGRDSIAAKAATEGALACWVGTVPAEEWWHANLTFYGPTGIGVASNVGEYQQHVLDLYHAAFSNRTLEKRMLFCEGNYCGAFGILWGQHVGTWVGQKASHKRVGVRFAMHFRVTEGLVQEGWAIFDFPGFFKQLGIDFFAKARDQPSRSA